MGSFIHASKQWRGLLNSGPIWLFALLTSSLAAYAQTSNYTVEVCPKALWRNAIFLKGPSSQETFTNVTKWKQEQFKTYVTKTVVPQAQANIVFVAMAVFALIFFLLWRLFRRCCICCCMRQSCEERFRAAEPTQVLSGWRYWLQKGLLLLFAVAAFCMMLAGIIMAPKHLFSDVWPPVNHMTTYLNTTTDHMSSLVTKTLGGVGPVLDNLTYLVNNDINLPQIKSNLQSIGATLDTSAANPNTPLSALSALNTSMASARTQIAALRPQLSSSSGLPASLTTLQAGLPGLSAAVATCNNYSTRLAGLDAPFTALNAATGPPFSTASLETAMGAVDVDIWRTNLGVMISALDVWRSLRSGNTLGALATSIAALNATFAGVKATQAPAAAAALTAFSNAWSSVSASMKALLDRITYVQANVATLDSKSNAVIVRLQSVYGNISSFTSLSPSPAGLAANLTALGGELSLGGTAASSLVTDLNNAQTAINGTQQSVLDDARNALANLKSALDALSPKFSATFSAMYTYKFSATQANFDAFKTSGTSTGSTWDLSKAAKTSADTAAGNSSVIAVQAAAGAGTLGPLATSIKTGSASVDTAVAASDASLESRPSLGQYMGLVSSVKGVYDTMPTPKSQELSAVTATISTIENLLVSLPATVRSQTASIQSSFGAGVDNLRNKVVVKADDLQRKNAKKVDDLDLARYRATCVLLALTAFVLVLLMVFVAINCPWGTGCAVFFLLLLAALLFLLGAVFAVVLAVAQDGCYHTEHVVLEGLGSSSSVTPLATYYFFGDNGTSVKSVLKAANLVDIDKVEGQVTGLADSMISNFTAQFTPQVKLATIITNIRGFINTTLSQIDSLLGEAGVSSVRPLYVGLKSYPCCDVTDYSFKLWGVLTFGGWLILVLSSMAMGFLGRLDQLPQSGCCGCKPIIGNRRNQVYPEGEGGGEEGPDEAGMVAPEQQTMAGAAAPGGAGAAPPMAAVVYPPQPAAGYPPPPAVYYPPQPQPSMFPPAPQNANTNNNEAANR